MKSRYFRFIVQNTNTLRPPKNGVLAWTPINLTLNITNSSTYIVNWALVRSCYGPETEHALVHIPGPFDANVQPFQQGLCGRRKTGICLFKPA